MSARLWVMHGLNGRGEIVYTRICGAAERAALQSLGWVTAHEVLP